MKIKVQLACSCFNLPFAVPPNYIHTFKLAGGGGPSSLGVTKMCPFGETSDGSTHTCSELGEFIHLCVVNLDYVEH